jgi:hypothetical protein
LTSKRAAGEEGEEFERALSLLDGEELVGLNGTT